VLLRVRREQRQERKEEDSVFHHPLPYNNLCAIIEA
jgi:hypothetical protein